MTIEARFASILMLLGMTASATAGELAVKDPVPDNPAWHGVTLYGVIDIDYAYLAHGAPLNGALPTGLAYNTILSAKYANRPVSSFAESAIEQSKAGLKIEEPVGNGWAVVGRLEGAFQPLSGEFADNCASLARNNGLPLTAQTSNLNGSRCGQVFSGPAYAGVSNAAYGTLTAGRQQSLGMDATAVYDPMALSAAFSFIGVGNATVAAFGGAENVRWDNSVKYVYQYGPAHVAAMYTGGGEDTAMFAGGYGFDAGVTWRGFSVDAVYGMQKSAILTSWLPYSTSTTTNGTCNATGTGGGTVCPGSNFIDGTVTDNEGWSAMGKYTHEFNGGNEGQGAKLSLFTGYVHIQLTNPQQAVATGSHTLGGYELYWANNQPYAPGSARILQTVWAGARYELPSGMSFAAAYYYVNQQAYLTNAAPGSNDCAAVTAANRTTAANCPGDMNMGSFLVDYPLNKHFDVYGGVNYSAIGGGLSSGFLNSSNAVFLTGLRLKL